ncbi:MAG: MotA/TolQ/ExbB proton channel [Firmicutes bacterium]|nr:MotA/TolQ/ExbB proton channel [Bacillota bacterium]
MGLLGTVVGMIDSFSVFSVQAGEPAAITGGVGEALIAHTYLAQLLDALITDIEHAAAVVMDYLPMPGTERKNNHEIA